LTTVTHYADSRTATDTGDRSTAVGFETDEDERAGVGTSVSEQLEALGYR
jgi:hypothetical protein